LGLLWSSGGDGLTRFLTVSIISSALAIKRLKSLALCRRLLSVSAIGFCEKGSKMKQKIIVLMLGEGVSHDMSTTDKKKQFITHASVIALISELCLFGAGG
jgi:hypothetical protein